MRQRFDQQLYLGVQPISQVQLPLKSRDELPPILCGLQYIFITPSLNEKIFALLEEKICEGKKKTGRKGMDLWHILVLAVVRHGLNTNWDRLELMANHDSLIRKILGVHTTSFGAVEFEFSYQSIIDNVIEVDEDLLKKINQLVVDAGHELLKKKDQGGIVLELKTDSYALETNVHFPTDLNLLWDSARKCLDTVKALQTETSLTGWRKIKHIRRTIKSQFRKTSHQVFAGKNEKQKKEAVKEYLQQVAGLQKRCEQIEKTIPAALTPKALALLIALRQYIDYVKKFSVQIERRLLKGEVIGSEEKLYSIFEPHTEWIYKGKKNKPVELGHLLLITTDQFQFITDYHIMEREKDASQIKPLQERLNKNFSHAQVASHSFDKGFWSKDNLETLQAGTTQQVVLPKRGKHTKADQEREGDKKFKAKRNAHSAIESNINMLEHHGLNRCMDKGMRGYKRCVGLSVLAYNLHILGNALQAQQRQEAEKVALRQAA